MRNLQFAICNFWFFLLWGKRFWGTKKIRFEVQSFKYENELVPCHSVKLQNLLKCSHGEVEETLWTYIISCRIYRTVALNGTKRCCGTSKTVQNGMMSSNFGVHCALLQYAEWILMMICIIYHFENGTQRSIAHHKWYKIHVSQMWSTHEFLWSSSFCALCLNSFWFLWDFISEVSIEHIHWHFTSSGVAHMRLLVAFLCAYLSFGPISGKYSYSDARSKFHDILFIVKYNYKVPKEIVRTHLVMWRRVFVNQVIFLPWSLEEINSFEVKNTTANANITIISHTDRFDGYHAYEVVPIAMKLFPNAAGYLYSHDDVALNVSTLIESNSSSFWYTKYFTAIASTCGDMKHDWSRKKKECGWWFSSPFGMDAMYALLSNQSDTARNVVTGMKSCLTSNRLWSIEQSDFFYVPRAYKDIANEVLSVFADHAIFVEIAVPTFYGCFVSPSDLVPLNLCTNFEQSIRINATNLDAACGAGFPIYHPIKLSTASHPAWMRKKMSLTASRVRSNHTTQLRR